jgi:hypothetical protein
MIKCIFKYFVTDECTYSYDSIIPFECDDLIEFIYNQMKKLQKSEYGCDILGVYVEKNKLDEIEHSFLTLEDWFEKEKFKQ